MSNETNYFNLHVTGLGYLNNVREVQTRNGSMLCCSINALTGATDNPAGVRMVCSHCTQNMVTPLKLYLIYMFKVMPRGNG